MRAIIHPFVAALGLLAAAGPAAAQEAPEPKVNQLIIYGEDKCPEATGDEIVICARKDERERFRIPEVLRESTSRSNEAWTNRVLAYEMVGRGGTLSCTPVGPGGWTGCTSQLINQAYAEKRTSSDVRMGDLIAAERARRLATIDAEAAETQKRVEALEQEYEARRKANEAAEAASAPAAPARRP